MKLFIARVQLNWSVNAYLRSIGSKPPTLLLNQEAFLARELQLLR
jgi:hypothetical protein